MYMLLGVCGRAALNAAIKLHLQEVLVNDLKQQLAQSEGARALAENQIMELCIAQKVVGQPTEVVIIMHFSPSGLES
jgi:hypothetical protein